LFEAGIVQVAVQTVPPLQGLKLREATPTVEPAKFVNNLKTVTSRALRKNHAQHLSKFYRKAVLWSGSYAIMTAGGAPLEVLKQYIQGQRKPTE
jgi:putative transposase